MRVNCYFVLLSLGFLVASSNIISSWNTFALECMNYNKSSPTVASRAFAMMSVSVYDSFCSIPPSKYKGYKYTVSQLNFANEDVSLEAIVVAASHTILVAIFPNQLTKIDTKYFEDLEALGETVPVFNGVYVGTRVARSVLADRAADGNSPYKPFSLGGGGGQGFWIPTPPSFGQAETPQWATMRPWCLKSPDQFRPSAPPTIISAVYAKDYNTIALLGKNTNSTRTQEETDIAAFWHDNALNRIWISIIENVALSKGFDLIDQAHMVALIQLAFADATIMAWDTKYQYGQWRPITAIRYNENPLWNSLWDTPPWPDYISDRAVIGATIAQILTRMFGDVYDLNITLNIHNKKDQRVYSSFWSAAFEEAQSQVYGGIHFNTSCTMGLQCGKLVGNWIYDYCFEQNVVYTDPAPNYTSLIVALSLVGFVLIILVLIVIFLVRRKRKAENKSPFVLEELDSQSNQDLQ